MGSGNSGRSGSGQGTVREVRDGLGDPPKVLGWFGDPRVVRDGS